MNTATHLGYPCNATILPLGQSCCCAAVKIRLGAHGSSAITGELVFGR